MKHNNTDFGPFPDTSIEAGARDSPISARELQEAFTKFVREPGIPFSFPSSESLKIRCAIADYILNSREGSLEDRLLEFVAAVPLDI